MPDAAFGRPAMGGSSGLKCWKRMEKGGKGTRKFGGAVFSVHGSLGSFDLPSLRKKLATK